MAITLVQSVVTNPVTAHLEFSATSGPSVSLGSGATANNLLVGYIYGTAVSQTFTAPSGWSIAKQFNGTQAIGGVAVMYKVAAGGETTFNPTMDSATGAMAVAEWSGLDPVSPLDQTGTAELSSSNTTLTVTTSGSVAQSSELVIAVFNNGNAISGWTMTGFTQDYDAQEGELGTKNATGLSGTTSATFSWTNTGLCSGVIATFQPSATGDPTIRPTPQLNVYRM